MTHLSDLMDMAESGTVLVFPTEESARAFSSAYVLARRKGLLASSSVAFDRFASIFMPGVRGMSAAGEAERSVFSSYAALVLTKRMHYFVSPDYPEMKARLASFFRPILPSLDDALHLPKKSREAAADLALLRREYGRYLEAAGLYESSFQPISIPDGLPGHYAIVMPEAFPKEERLVSAIKDLECMTLIDDLADAYPPLTVYDNEKGEIRALFSSIRELADSGVSLDSIAVSVAAFGRLRPYLEEESYIFGIPLDFREGLPPSASAPGAFLSGLADIYSSSYSLDSLKSWMLNPSIPFREPEKMRRFIAEAVRFSITSAPDRKTDRYMKLPEENGGGLYRILRLTLDKLMAETDPDRILMYLHTISSSMLADDEFRSDPGDADIYAFTMNALSGFLDTLKAASSAGFSAEAPVFPLFIEYLKELKYVPKERIKGVSVYPFTQDAAVPFAHRFIIGLNEKEGTETVKKASFLSDYELSQERSETDITRTLLSLYAAMTDDLHLSASYETYAGFMLPLSFMIASSVKGTLPSDDPVQAEAARRKTGMILPLQRRGYERGLMTSLRRRSRKDDMTYDKRGSVRELPVVLSFTSCNAYARCPYMYALQYAFGLRNLPSFEPMDMDHLEIGSRLHSILERYYRHGGTSPDEDIMRMFDEEMKAWTDGKRFNSDDSLSDMPPSASRPTPFLISYLRTRYLHRLMDAVKEMNRISRPLPDGRGLEVPLQHTFSDEGFRLEGRVDRIALSPDGSSYIIYDYKKGRQFRKDDRPEKSMQFHIYRLLLGSDGELCLPVSEAFFVTLLDGRITPASTPPDMSDLKASLGESAHGIAAGDWHAAPSNENCSACPYRGICRRRFSVR